MPLIWILSSELALDSSKRNEVLLKLSRLVKEAVFEDFSVFAIQYALLRLKRFFQAHWIHRITESNQRANSVVYLVTSLR